MHRILSALLVLSVALGLIVASALQAQRSFARLNAQVDALRTASAIRLQLEQVLSLFKDLETGTRGFMLTGRDEYLEPYRVARQRVADEYPRLQAVTGANGPDGFDWRRLDARVEERLTLAGQLIALRRRLGERTVDDPAVFEPGRRAMDAIRDDFAALEEHYRTRIEALSADMVRQRRQTARFGWFADGLAVLLVTLAAFLLLRERRWRLRLEAALREANRDLEQRVDERTREIAAARDRIAGFAAELDRHIEAERLRLSREVHDQLGPVFTAIRLLIRSAPSAALPADQVRALDQALEMGITTTRRIAAELRPPLLDDLGLGAALEHLLTTLPARDELQASVEIRDDERLGTSAALTLYRIAREALTNVLRHAEADRVRIDGRVGPDWYILCIEDNGRGFDPERVRTSALGLVGMRERAALAGGVLTVETPSGGGTRIRIELPLHDDST